jgi:hypothetical protein
LTSRRIVTTVRLVPTAATLAACAAFGLVGFEAAARGACGPPRLTIVSPTPGETVRAPLRAQFSGRCFLLGPAPYGHIHAWTGPPGTSPRFELRPRRQAGVVELRDPLLSGRHT